MLVSESAVGCGRDGSSIAIGASRVPGDVMEREVCGLSEGWRPAAKEIFLDLGFFADLSVP
jgi:hypothetical protein